MKRRAVAILLRCLPRICTVIEGADPCPAPVQCRMYVHSAPFRLVLTQIWRAIKHGCGLGRQPRHRVNLISRRFPVRFAFLLVIIISFYPPASDLRPVAPGCNPSPAVPCLLAMQMFQMPIMAGLRSFAPLAPARQLVDPGRSRNTMQVPKGYVRCGSPTLPHFPPGRNDFFSRELNGSVCLPSRQLEPVGRGGQSMSKFGSIWQPQHQTRRQQ